MTNNQNLKPCPLCSHNPTVTEFEIGNGATQIKCQNCGLNIFHEEKEAAQTAWNTRTVDLTPAQLQEAIVLIGSSRVLSMSKEAYDILSEALAILRGEKNG